VLMAYAESDRIAQSWLAAFRGALTKLGWTEGSNLRIELRWSADNADRMRALAKELVDLRPNAIFGVTTPVIGALARETKTIPIVFAGVSDPIGSGFAANLAHPGGNITGFTVNDPAAGGKWVQLLKEIAPRTVHVALLFNPATTVPIQFFMPSIQAAALSNAVEVSAAPVHAKDEIEGVVAAQARNPGGGLIAMPDVFNDVNRELIIAKTLSAPAMAPVAATLKGAMPFVWLVVTDSECGRACAEKRSCRATTMPTKGRSINSAKECDACLIKHMCQGDSHERRRGLIGAQNSNMLYLRLATEPIWAERPSD
jgi:ABC transporter substrate binding protein